MSHACHDRNKWGHRCKKKPLLPPGSSVQVKAADKNHTWAQESSRTGALASGLERSPEPLIDIRHRSLIRQFHAVFGSESLDKDPVHCVVLAGVIEVF